MIFLFTSFTFVVTIMLCTVIGSSEIAPELGPGFELSQSTGPVFLEYGSKGYYKDFLFKSSLNTQFWYVNGEWSLYPPTGEYEPISGRLFIKGGSIDVYTSNYAYPFLKDQDLPLDKTYLGNFELVGGESVANIDTYRRYFSDGTLSVYSFCRNKEIYFTGDLADELSLPFLEWYISWANVEKFKIYKHFYFPLDRDHSNWVTLLQLDKISFPNPLTLTSEESWRDFADSSNFSSIDFLENSGRVALHSVDPEIWVQLYTPEQAMFRYYEASTGTIGLWSPADLVLSHEIEKISCLIEKKPEEVLAVFSNWLSGTGPKNPLYFNYIGVESFDWANDPWYDIGYVC